MVLDKDSLMEMDPNIAVSIINLKLRDFYSSLSEFCDDIGADQQSLESKLLKHGYTYKEDINQFR